MRVSEDSHRVYSNINVVYNITIMEKKQGKQRTILIFSTAYLPLVGGAELAVSEITQRISDFNFILLTARLRRDLPSFERIGNIEVRRLGFGVFPFLDKLLSPFWGAVLARRLMQKNDVALFWSIMVSFASGAPFLLKLSGLSRRIPILLTLQEGDSERHLKFANLGLTGLAWFVALRMSDHIQAISTYLERFARQRGARAPITIIPNGVDIQKFKMKNEKLKTAKSKTVIQELKSKYGIKETEKIIVTASRLVHKNAVDIIVRALALLRGHGVPARLLVLGSGPEENGLRHLAKTLGVADAIIWAGLTNYNDLPDYLVLGDMFVRPSRSEGLGTAFIEAMAAGIPVVGTPVGGIPDFLKDGETGVISRMDDPEDLAEKITRLFQDSVFCDKLVVRARRLVEERYQWEGISYTMQQLFTRLAQKQKGLRVLIATPLYPPEIGGPATYAKTLFETFPKHGISVSVLPFSDVRYLPRGIRHLLYGLRVLRRGLNNDVIFALDPVSVGFPAFLAALLLRKKFAVKIVGDYAWEQGVQRFGISDTLDDFVEKKYGWQTELLKKIQTLIAQHAEAIITPSKYLRRIVSLWKVAQDNIHVIYNAIDVPEIHESRAELRQKLHKDGKILFSAGRLVPWKGFAMLIAAVAEIRETIPDAHLFIAGDGPEHENLKLKIKNEKLEEHITLLGRLSHKQLLRHVAAADIFLLNTAYEGLSHQLLEVMAIGVPIVTTAVGGNTELITDGENGIFVPYNDKTALVSAVKRLLGDVSLRERLASRARADAGRFTQERMVQETIALLKHI